MRYQLVAAALMTLALGVPPTLAQDQRSNSAADQGAGSTSGDKATSPKTTGAMNKTTDSVATSPQDVGAQQKGEKTAAEGGGDRPGAPKIDEKQVSPGTVGAAPATGGKADTK
ncbi:hypothetical protein [Hansschlegelia zhihuaiae]|uniref:Uncharacterized protein n=1 Tax=Hansschlegelia zhihuaiae TaxID=405005 RepID=A0A4Q0M7X2_9HYPH|nr:hypothetical protein [Hansschlegelia zhihuaiae]RXF69220.1 hypothetical protein EK403_18715 [Hansschlegelia zhihuaiae]